MKPFKLIMAILLFTSCGNNNDDVETTETDTLVTSDTVYTALADTAR